MWLSLYFCCQVGYPGFAIFTPGPLEELKVKEIKNGRLAMLAFIGFTMAAQVSAKIGLAVVVWWKSCGNSRQTGKAAQALRRAYWGGALDGIPMAL